MPRPLKLPEDLREVLDNPRFYSAKAIAALFELWETVSLDNPERGLKIAAILDNLSTRVQEHAERLNRRALEIRTKAICGRAGNLRSLRRYEEAEATLLEGLELLAATDYINRANILRNLAILRGNQLRFREALDFVNQAIDLARGESQTLGKAILAKGVILLNQGAGSEALSTICASLKYLDPKKSAVVYFKALQALMAAVVDVKDFAGLSVLRAPLREARKHVPSNSEMIRRRIRWIEGIGALRVGANRLAEEVLSETLTTLDARLTPQERFHLRIDLAQACLGLPQHERAIAYLWECVSIIQKLGLPRGTVAEVERLIAELERGGRGRLPWDVRTLV